MTIDEEGRGTEQQVLGDPHRTERMISLGQLAGGVAHDVANLLAAIVNYAGLARRHMTVSSARDGAAVYHALESIETLSMCAANLTRRVMVHARGRSPASSQVHLGRVVENLEPLVGVAVDKNATFVKHLSPKVPPIVGDVAQIEQMVLNLLVNASEALTEGAGTVTVSTRVAKLESAAAADLGVPAGCYVALSVEDDGRGMDSTTATRIFEPNFSTKLGARGVGLATVLEVVRGHGGAIDVTSAVGCGTTFVVYLPLVALDANEVPSTSRTGPSTEPQTIIVADDEPSIREALTIIMEALGFQCLSASSGAEALALLEEHRADVALILVDMALSGASGLETLERARTLAPTLPMVLSAGADTGEARERARRSSVTLLPKPYRVDDLERAIREAMTLQNNQGANTVRDVTASA